MSERGDTYRQAAELVDAGAGGVVVSTWTEAERDAAAQVIERHFYDGSSTEDYYDDDSGDEDRAIAAAVLDVVAPMIAERAIKQAADRVRAAFSGDEYEENALAASQDGDYASWSRWLALRAVTGVACKHTEGDR